MSQAIGTARGKPWYKHLTIDLIAVVLQKTLFHPFVAWMFPLCARALHAPYESREFIASCAYAAVVTLAWILAGINHRVAYGAPRVLDWDEEVIVITGGSSGLGKILAQTYGMRGVSVAILDVQELNNEDEGLENVRFYRCDVGDAASVDKARAAVEKDLGVPTILINNAGIVNGRRLWELSTSQVQRNFSVNLVSHFHTIRAFLPGMLSNENGGTIVTVASVLGKLGASYLSDYTAAKAGLIAMHTSLRAELASASRPQGAENIRTVLVTPGQLSTAMFAGVEPPSNFVGPVVEPVDLAREITRLVDAGEGGEISLPLYTQYIEWLGVLPAGLQKPVRWLSGVDSAMEKAHAKQKSR